jgi:hypothetical protein
LPAPQFRQIANDRSRSNNGATESDHLKSQVEKFLDTVRAA